MMNNPVEIRSEKAILVGYKNTELGLIPEDWDVINLNELASFGGGTTPSRALFDKYYSSGVHPWAKTLDLNNGAIWKTEELVTDSALNETSLKKHKAGSVLIAMYGGFNQIGRTGLLKIDSAINQALVSISPHKNKLTPEYLLYNLNYNVDYWKMVASSSRKDPNITSNDIKYYCLPLTSVAEQIAIANVLSDTDALITELEHLISKKQAIKTATMQQLLTGRTRLPQFAKHPDGVLKGNKPSELGLIPVDWICVKLGEIGQCIIGLTYSPRDVSDSGTLVLRSSNVQNNKLAYQDNVFVNMDLPERVIVRKGDILICVRNGSRKLIGKCALIDHTADGCAFGAFMAIYRTTAHDFIFYQFQSNLIHNQIDETMGATINQITNKDLSGFIISMPSCDQEQTAIATILLDMDAELEALEQKLAKFRDIKQGMMQQLLTGRIRLPLDRQP